MRTQVGTVAHWRKRLGGALAVVVALAAVTVLDTRPAAADPPGPPLQTPVAELDKAVHCDESIDRPGRTPVLFIPGSSVKGNENFAWNFMVALKKEGHPVCWVNYPHRGWRDLQVTSEYVVHAIRTVHERAGRKIATVGHSQGGLHGAWVQRFWPDLPSRVTDVISLGSPFQGSKLANLCNLSGAALVGCPQSFWQYRWHSNWSRALVAKPVPDGPAFTSIYTLTDQFAIPGRESSFLPGARHVGVQEICPARPLPEHLMLAVDAVAYALTLDALSHDGPADPARVPRSVCNRLLMPLDVVEALKTLPNMALEAIFHAVPDAANMLTGWVREEPPVRDYAKN
ncbi:hypothetical protein GCM10012275_25600 [Longimycelium tulufanense]|uniref:Lipase n=1 Tax=Longimycelium tulufanense TaxID=907463 RepID=A0A8J3CE50_9PSEU|nr:hypothetical protein [Longimycelium tulufanense]GGM53452.1 hypothetical protein GCM10012275_25600 [Longimycelium tulufanense]